MLDTAFSLLTAFVVLFWAAAARRAGGARGYALASISMIVLLGATWMVASRGLLDGRTFPLLVVPLTIAVVVLARSRAGVVLATRVPLAWLVGFQVFRVGVELWLHAGWRHGVVPVQMTYGGRNFDILAGLTAPIVALLHRKLGRAGVLAWNVASLLLLANIVVIAVLSLPGRHVFTETNTFVLHVPYVWLPAVLVQSALLGHLLVFRASQSPYQRA